MIVIVGVQAEEEKRERELSLFQSGELVSACVSSKPILCTISQLPRVSRYLGLPSPPAVWLLKVYILYNVLARLA